MKIVHAMTLRDGGTTCVSVDDQGVVKHVTFDYQLPGDGRLRYVYVSDREFSTKARDRLPPDSPQEAHIIRAIREAAEQELGPEMVEGFLGNPAANPGKGKWFYVLNFLRIATRERGAS